MAKTFIGMVFGLLCTVCTMAQLVVTVGSPKIVGQKAVVELTMKNHLTNTIESARVICFLLDDQGKMIGQSTKWVIGQNKIALATNMTNTFNFVITSPQPFATTNLTAKVRFSRMVVEGGKLIDISKHVTMVAATNN